MRDYKRQLAEKTKRLNDDHERKLQQELDDERLVSMLATLRRFNRTIIKLVHIEINEYNLLVLKVRTDRLPSNFKKQASRI